MRAQREAKAIVVTRMFGVTKKKKRAVTKSRNIVTLRNTPEKGADRSTGKVKAPTPRPAGAGRPKVHATAADRQRAYRERKKVQR